MSVWLEGESDIDCDLGQVRESLEHPGEHHVGVVSRMPGMTTVELVDQGPDSVTIRTNEGLMSRSHISVRAEAERIIADFDEDYRAGKMNFTSHHHLEFTAQDNGVHLRVVLSDLDAPGLMGFFYRRLGRRSMRKAFVQSHRDYFERSAA